MKNVNQFKNIKSLNTKGNFIGEKYYRKAADA